MEAKTFLESKQRGGKDGKIRVDWRKGSFTTFFMMQYARHSMLTKTKPITFATVQWLNATIKKRSSNKVK